MRSLYDGYPFSTRTPIHSYRSSHRCRLPPPSPVCASSVKGNRDYYCSSYSHQYPLFHQGGVNQKSRNRSTPVIPTLLTRPLIKNSHMETWISRENLKNRIRWTLLPGGFPIFPEIRKIRKSRGTRESSEFSPRCSIDSSFTFRTLRVTFWVAKLLEHITYSPSRLSLFHGTEEKQAATRTYSPSHDLAC